MLISSVPVLWIVIGLSWYSSCQTVNRKWFANIMTDRLVSYLLLFQCSVQSVTAGRATFYCGYRTVITTKYLPFFFCICIWHDEHISACCFKLRHLEKLDQYLKSWRPWLSDVAVKGVYCSWRAVCDRTSAVWIQALRELCERYSRQRERLIDTARLKCVCVFIRHGEFMWACCLWTLFALGVFWWCVRCVL